MQSRCGHLWHSDSHGPAAALNHRDRIAFPYSWSTHGLGYRICFTQRMTHARQRLGSAGEELACAELERLGYAVIERNYRSRFGEIDIVARDGDTVVFVEVKTKTSGDFGDPVEEVTPQKQRQILSMGEEYHSYCCQPDTPCRFDVVAVDVSVMPPKITIYKDAFRPGW